MVKHNQTIRRLLPTNRLSVFDHFVGLALKNSFFQQYVLIFSQQLLLYYHNDNEHYS